MLAIESAVFDDLATVRMLFKLRTLVAVEGHNATIRIDNEYGLCGVQNLEPINSGCSLFRELGL